MPQGKKRIQVYLSDENFVAIKNSADEEGMSVQKYIYKKLSLDNEFDRLYADLLRRVEQLSAGQIFSVRTIFGVDWINIARGLKLSLGRIFYRNVAVFGKIAGVSVAAKDSSGVQCYMRTV